jgi:alkylmercury lyase
MKATELTKRLSTSFLSMDDANTLFVTLLRTLIRGEPIPQSELALLTGWSSERITTALEAISSIEIDEAKNIVGAGLTLRKTPHVFEVEGRQLYTWCALDALMFPPIIGKPARITSPCPSTGTLISLTVTPEGVSNLDPREAVVSLVLPDASSDVRSAFCRHVSFFSSETAAQAWLSSTPGGTVVNVTEAFRLGQDIALQCFLGKPKTSC